jgi:hypothetical protein
VLVLGALLHQLNHLVPARANGTLLSQTLYDGVSRERDEGILDTLLLQLGDYQISYIGVEREVHGRDNDTCEQLVELLRRRDKLNLELIGLYGISTDGKDKSKNAQGRFNAELNGRRAAYKKQIPKMKRLDKYRVGFDDKKKLCSLMDERTEMMARLACINYIFKKEKPKKDAKRELSRERKKIKRGLAVNERDYNRLEDRILRRASRNNSSKNAMIIGWVVILLLAAAGVGVFLCWDLIWPHIQGFIQSIKDSMNK